MQEVALFSLLCFLVIILYDRLSLLSQSGPLKEADIAPCGCMATEHAFLVNCLHCGRILCEKESAEVCFACGSDPRTSPGRSNPVALFFEEKPQNDFVQSDTRNESTQDAEALAQAISNQNEILLRQQRKEELLKVYDEDKDYFSSTAWTTSEEREANIRARKEHLERQQKRVDPDVYRVQLDVMNKNIAVCANLQSSLTGGLASLDMVENANSEKMFPKTLAQHAVQRALSRLELSRNILVTESGEDGVHESPVLNTCRKDESRVRRVEPNPSIEPSKAPQYVFTHRELLVPKWASTDEVEATESKFQFLQSRKKVHIESNTDT